MHEEWSRRIENCFVARLCYLSSTLEIGESLDIKALHMTDSIKLVILWVTSSLSLFNTTTLLALYPKIAKPDFILLLIKEISTLIFTFNK